MTCSLTLIDVFDCLKMDINCSISKNLADIVNRDGSATVVYCEHCNTITNFDSWRDQYEIGEKTYRVECRNCSKMFPGCCVSKYIHSEEYYEKHPKDPNGGFGRCHSCIKKIKEEKEKKQEEEKKKQEKERQTKKRRKTEERECYNCSVPESDCEDIRFSPCKTCHEEVCDMCILNGLCAICHVDLGFNTDGLQVGDRVVYSDCGPILTEATVKKMKGSKVLIRCDRDYEMFESRTVWAPRKYLRKI